MAGLNIGDVFMRVLADMTGFEADVTKQAQKAGDKAGNSMGQRMSKGLTAGMTAVGAAGGMMLTGAIGAAANFEDQLRTINTVAHLTDEELQGVGQSILDLSKETGKSTDDLTAGFYDLVSAGVPAEQAIAVLKDSAVLATGALGTTAETVDLVTSALNAYGLDAKESTRITDIFAQAVADGKVTASELGNSLANIAPIASSAGVSLEEVSAGYAILTAKGVPAAQAATQMRAAISALLTPNEKLNELQQEMGKNFADIAREKGLAVALEELRQATGGNAEAFAKALGSVEAYQFAVQTTGDNAAAFATELDKVTVASEQGGVAQGQYEERMKSAKMQAEKFVAGIRATAMEVGGPFVDSLGGAVLALNELGGGMGGLVNLSRLFGGTIGGAAGFLTSRLGPKFKAGIVGALAKVVIPGALLAKPLEDGLADGLTDLGKSSKVKGATGKLGDLLGSKLGKGLSVAFAAVMVYEVFETYNRVKEGLLEQTEQISTDVGNQLASGTTESLQQSKAALEQGLKDLDGVWDAGLFTGDTRRSLQEQLAGVNAELERRAAGMGPAVASGMEQGAPAVAAAGASLAGAAVDGIDALDEKARAEGEATARAYAEGVQTKRDVVSQALATFRQALENEMSPAKERARIIGELTGKELAKGLKSKDPIVRQAAKDAKAALLTRLSEITGESGKLGRKTGDMLAKALKSKDPDIRAAARQVKETIEKKLRETKATQAGKRIGEGVKDGLASKKGPIGAVAYNMGKYIAKKVVAGVTIYVGKQVPDPGRATGGQVQANQPYLVGERGRELFVPNQTGTIITNQRTDTILGEQVSGPTGDTNINVQTYGLPMRAETPMEVVHRLRQATRLGVVTPPRRPPAWRPT